MKAIIAGAGLAGLTCAKVLNERGAEVVVFEASDGIGGRVRTDEHDGFLLDRGFQVYFTAYPAAKRHLDHEALNLQTFDPGAVICRGRKKDTLADPRRDLRALPSSLLSDVATFGDRLRTLRLAAEAATDGVDSASESPAPDTTTLDYLREQGFSEKFVDEFFRPFYGGIFLNRVLETSARVFRFTFQMLARGETVVPARGMGEIPRQLAAHLPEDAIHPNSPVDELLREDGRVTGVRAAGEEHEADAVVVATEAPAAGGLTGESVPGDSVGEVCLYYATDRPGSNKKILLNAQPDAFLNNAQEMSAVAPHYAPPGRGLVSAVALGVPEMPDDELYRRGLEELSLWYPDADFEPLALYRIPYGQFAQPPGVHDRLPRNRTATSGLFLAGEYTQDSSINGAMLSGEGAARAALEAAGA